MHSFRHDEDYSFLIGVFGKEAIKSRYDTLEDEINTLLKKFGYSKDIVLNSEAMRLTLDSYFSDIARLKDFSAIDRVNTAKIFGYTVYWFCRIHPLNIVTPNKNYNFINERVILYLVIKRLLVEYININEKNPYAYGQILESCELMLYNLKYRVYTPQSLECAFLNILTATSLDVDKEPILI